LRYYRIYIVVLSSPPLCCYIQPMPFFPHLSTDQTISLLIPDLFILRSAIMPTPFRIYFRLRTFTSLLIPPLA
jgi:hypothetical protein